MANYAPEGVDRDDYTLNILLNTHEHLIDVDVWGYQFESEYSEEEIRTARRQRSCYISSWRPSSGLRGRDSSGGELLLERLLHFKVNVNLNQYSFVHRGMEVNSKVVSACLL